MASPFPGMDPSRLFTAAPATTGVLTISALCLRLNCGLRWSCGLENTCPKWLPADYSIYHGLAPHP